MNILIIEDDKDLCCIMKTELQKNNFKVDICNDGDDAFFYTNSQTYDIIILDRMLPNKDGIEILNQMRKNNICTPVIMVTAMDTIQNKIEGLDSGADDYLVKPFVMEELFARIRALTRRPSQIINNSNLSFSNICLNINQNILESDSTSCTISKRESDLLAFFIKNKSQVLTREMILTRVWGADSDVTDSNLDNFICFLRKRLKTVKSKASLKTIRGVGYRLEDDTNC